VTTSNLIALLRNLTELSCLDATPGHAAAWRQRLLLVRERNAGRVPSSGFEPLESDSGARQIFDTVLFTSSFLQDVIWGTNLNNKLVHNSVISLPDPCRIRPR
jgi:hypothetical protein